MIAGITHLAMEAELARGIELGAELGFAPDFSQSLELPAGFEGAESTAHPLPLAVLVADSGIRLEVVQHRRRSGRRGAYTGVFRRPPGTMPGPEVSRPDVRELLRRAGVLRDPICVATTIPGTDVWFDSAPSGNGLAGILCSVPDVASEAAFWRAFARAKWTSVDAAAAAGVLPGALPHMSCAFVITCSGAGKSAHAMNDSGFPSIGVFTTDILRDCERARSAGAMPLAGPIDAEVGGRPVRLALIATPGGAPVELLSVPKTRATSPGGN